MLYWWDNLTEYSGNIEIYGLVLLKNIIINLSSELIQVSKCRKKA